MILRGDASPSDEGMTSKSILITGCSSGIGYDAAHTLHVRGWQVFASCRSEADVERLQSEGLNSVVLDIASDESIDNALTYVLKQTGGTLDAVFNNGAFAIPGLVEDLRRDALQDIFNTNLFGTVELTNRVLPIMRRQGHGRIVMCSSVLGFAAGPFRGAYTSTKYALEGMTDTLRLELRSEPSLQVILIEPGPIKTLIRENSIPHFERWIDVDASASSERYKQLLVPRLYKPAEKKDRFELPPSAVTEKLIHAIEHPKPQPRYYVTVPTRLAGIFKRITSTRWFDYLCDR